MGASVKGARLRPCPHPGCAELVDAGFCQRHRRQRDKQRGSARERGYSAAWDKASKAFLIANPICSQCGRMAECTDHVIPHRGNKALFWDVTNWDAKCSTCHGIKTGMGL